MAKQYSIIGPAHRDFIGRQRVFFTASAASGSRINLSPRGTEAFRIVDDQTICWLDRTGSGNETAAHMLADGRLTVMFCAFEGPPLILRLYGHGQVLHRQGTVFADWKARWFADYSPLDTRQIVRLDVDLVQTSCGFGVPLFDYQGERDAAERWVENKGRAGIEAYWAEKNVASMDGLPTGLLDAPVD